MAPGKSSVSLSTRTK